MITPPTDMPDQTTVLSDPSPLPSQTSAPQPVQTQAAQPQPRPSLFRSILSGVLLGMSQGMAARTPGQAAALGSQAVIAKQEQDRANQRADEQLALQKQVSLAQITKDLGTADREHAEAALALTHKLLYEQQLSQLPAQQRAALSESVANVVHTLESSGFQLSYVLDDTPENRQKFLSHLGDMDEQASNYSYFPMPDGRIGAFQRSAYTQVSDDTVKAAMPIIKQAFPFLDEYKVKGFTQTQFDYTFSKALDTVAQTSVSEAREKAIQVRQLAIRAQAKAAGLPDTAIGMFGNLPENGKDRGLVFRELAKSYNQVQQTDQSYSQASEIMNRIRQTGQISGADAMTLLSLHIATTFGGVKGARIGRDLIEAHLKARDLPEDVEALSRRVLQGGNMSAQQAENFYGLIQSKRKIAWQSLNDTAGAYGVKLDPTRIPADLQSQQPTSGPSAQPITATGPGGQKLVLQNGQWVPAR